MLLNFMRFLLEFLEIENELDVLTIFFYALAFPRLWSPGVGLDQWVCTN